MGTKRGLSGPGPERRPRPCSAASEGPVFRSQAAGNPRGQGHGPPLLGFLPGRSAFVPQAPGGRWPVSSLRPGLDRAPEVSVCPAPTWRPGTPPAGVLAFTDRGAPQGLACPHPLGAQAPPRRPGPMVLGWALGEDRAPRPRLPPGLSQAPHLVLLTPGQSWEARLACMMWPALGTCMAVGGSWATGGCSARNVASLGGGLAAVPPGDSRAVGSYRLGRGAGRWGLRRCLVGGVAMGTQWVRPNGPSRWSLPKSSFGLDCRP